jgi:hypothetical protein
MLVISIAEDPVQRLFDPTLLLSIQALDREPA